MTTTFSLAFVAHEVHRRGGMERAAAEVLTRVARRIPVTVIARHCELPGTSVRFLPIDVPDRPAIYRTWAFARNAHAAERVAGCTISNSIGAAAIDAEVITAQFCHAAFTARFGGIRGGTGVRALYQRFAQSRFVAEERVAYGSRRLRHVIAVSEGTSHELQEFYRVPAERITVVPNGVDRNIFRPAVDAASKHALRESLGLPVDRCLALFVGGDWDRKGVRDAILAVAGLADTSLVVLGRGDVERFRAIASENGARDQVIFATPTSSPERFYAAADLFLFPSRYEAFSLVTLEAAAAGLPIVAHRINGTEELVHDGVNGWLVPQAADALREKVMALRDDCELRDRMSAANTANCSSAMRSQS
jgi:glycosyltransferase involved in cell wall biosynthesis